MMILLSALIIVIVASSVGYVLVLIDTKNKKEAIKIFLWMLTIGMAAIALYIIVFSKIFSLFS